MFVNMALQKEIKLKPENENVIENSFEKKVSEENFIYNESMCSICNLYSLNLEVDVNLTELNLLVEYIWNRIGSWVCTF